MKTALIRVALREDAAGKPTCRGCDYYHHPQAYCMKNNLRYGTMGMGQAESGRCFLRDGNEADRLVGEAQRLIADVIENYGSASDLPRLKDAQNALKKARGE